MKRSIQDIMNSKVSVVIQPVNKPIVHSNKNTLEDVLFKLSNIWKEQLIAITKMPYHSEQQKSAKLCLPRVYVGGTFSDWHTRDDNVLAASNLMTIDIDFVDNPTMDMNELQQKIFDLPFVAVCLKSCSGAGIFAIVPIEDYKKTTLYYQYLKKLLFQKYGVVIDSKASNIARARFLSYNEDYRKWIKQGDVQVWQLYDEPKIEKHDAQTPQLFSKYKSSNESEKLLTAVKNVLKSGYCATNYGHWYHTGCDLAAFDCGRELWQQFCDNGARVKSDWNDNYRTIEAKWKECLKNRSIIDDEFKRKWFGLAKRYS